MRTNAGNFPSFPDWKQAFLHSARHRPKPLPSPAKNLIRCLIAPSGKSQLKILTTKAAVKISTVANERKTSEWKSERPSQKAACR